jgi:methylthioribose-1-phosphate isomerase
LIDQRKLPTEEVYVECRDYDQIAEAIEKMVIRGAPAIGVAAAFGVALGIRNLKEKDKLQEGLRIIIDRLKRTRPTARNLFWALTRMKAAFENNQEMALSRLQDRLVEEALAIEREDYEANKKIGSWGKNLVQDGDSILTHCNAGALATAGYGTALGIIRSAVGEKKRIQVYVSETRPFLQGARLTCWELDKDNIPVILITDNMAGHLMQRGQISLVITGADRIASNGDTANKIGTYTMAVLAKAHGIPFYVAAPLSTVDFSLDSGDQIPIEQRAPDEVRKLEGQCLVLPHIKALNPAFDVTPAEYLSAIITEKGIVRPPFEKNLEPLE